MLRAFFGLCSAAQEASVVDAPDGPPTSVAGFIYGGNLIGVQWANGDAAAWVHLAQSASEPSAATIVLPPGSTIYETGDVYNELTFDSYNSWWVRHYTTGGTSAWVEWDSAGIP